MAISNPSGPVLTLCKHSYLSNTAGNIEFIAHTNTNLVIIVQIEMHSELNTRVIPTFYWQLLQKLLRRTMDFLMLNH